MLGDKFLQKRYRQKKPKLVTISTLALLQSYESVLRTLNVLKPGDIIVATDVNGFPEKELTFGIFTNKEVQSRTRKD